MNREKISSSTLYDLAKKVVGYVKESKGKEEIVINKQPFLDMGKAPLDLKLHLKLLLKMIGI